MKLQTLWRRLLAIVEEQAQVVMRTAFCTIVRESGDLSVVLYDVRGRMLAQAQTGTPGFINTMGDLAGHRYAVGNDAIDGRSQGLSIAADLV